MRVASTLEQFKVGDFVLVLPCGMGTWDFEDIRNEWRNDNYELDEQVQVGEVKGLDYSHSNDEILLSIFDPKTTETGSYTLDRVMPLKNL